MKPFDQLNYYEILEVPVSASLFDIRCSYKDLLAVYSEESLSTYTLFSREEREQIKTKITEAYNTLSDEKKRARYDNQLLQSGTIDSEELSPKKEKKPVPVFQAVRTTVKENIIETIAEKVKTDEVKALADEINGKSTLSGKNLKKLREALGVELSDVFEVSRISTSVLQTIEGDKFQELPSPVHLKGFLKSYAELFHLDPERVIKSYCSNIPRGENKNA